MVTAASRAFIRGFNVAVAALIVVPGVVAAQGTRAPSVNILLPPSVDGVLPIVAEGGPRITTENILGTGDLRALIR
ncbi:MAG: hypothetical protein H0X64_10875, partial [Gemmatimonadaceae bacterium]|nr:hypothetical protein [Gemmatimonadaceae bacterium]